MAQIDNSEEIENAKRILAENGYAVESLWSVGDVFNKYDCSKEEALSVMNGALRNEATMEQIHFAIEVHAEAMGLNEKEISWAFEFIDFDDINNLELRSDFENNEIPKEFQFKFCGKISETEESFAIDLMDIEGFPVETYLYSSETEYNQDEEVLFHLKDNIYKKK